MSEHVVKFQVSVIIPVFNREKFIRKAVESSSCLNEVGEILIVDDGSTDNTLNICRDLEKEFPKVRLIQHPDRKNHGVSASRNLGIDSATTNYIAFLDSDDYYLPNRFKKDKELFEANSDIDGVYNALGIEYLTSEGKETFLNKGYQYQEFLTISGDVPPAELFFVLFNKHPKFKGEFHGNTLTVRKSIFQKSGIFHTGLKLKEDIHLWRRMAAVGNLVAGNIDEPVAIRGVHDENTMLKANIQNDAYDIWWIDLKQWFSKKHIKKEYRQCFFEAYNKYKMYHASKVMSKYYFFRFYISSPSQLFKTYSAFDFDFLSVFGRNYFTLHAISLKNKILTKKGKLTQ